MDTQGLHDPWSIYARLQNESRRHDRVSDASWGIERGLNLILSRIAVEGLAYDPKLLSAEVEKAINSGSWSERHHARLRCTHSHVFPKLTANNAHESVQIGEIGGQLDEDDWQLILAIGEGKTYHQMECETGVSRGALRTRISRIRARLLPFRN
jgi:hypothetical protein